MFVEVGSHLTMRKLPKSWVLLPYHCFTLHAQWREKRKGPRGLFASIAICAAAPAAADDAPEVGDGEQVLWGKPGRKEER